MIDNNKGLLKISLALTLGIIIFYSGRFITIEEVYKEIIFVLYISGAVLWLSKYSLSIQLDRLFLGGTFIISAVAKIYSMNFFDGLVASQLIGDDFFNHPSSFFGVQILTRVLIAGEFMLGVAILQKKYLKTIVLPVMAILLVVFSLQVFYEAQFNDKGYIGGNCGCFGDVIPFDNLQTLFKNVVLLLTVGVVYFKYKDRTEMTFGPVVPSLMVGAFTLVTLLLTIDREETVEVNDNESNIIVTLDSTETKSEINQSSNLNFENEISVEGGLIGQSVFITIDSVSENSTDSKMWFLLPGAEVDSLQIKPGETVTTKYTKEGTFDVLLIIQNEGKSDTIVKKGLVEIKEKGINGEANFSHVSKDDKNTSNTSVETNVVKEENVKTVSNSIFYPYRTGWSTGETKDLETGTHLICMFSLTCGHCQASYRDILEAQKKGAKFGKSYVLGYGGEFDLKNFWRKTGKESPYIIIDKYAKFAKVLNGDGFPKIIVVENGVFKKTWTSRDYSKESFFEYFGIKETKEIPTDEGNLFLDDNDSKGEDLILGP